MNYGSYKNTDIQKAVHTTRQYTHIPTQLCKVAGPKTPKVELLVYPELCLSTVNYGSYKNTDIQKAIHTTRLYTHTATQLCTHTGLCTTQPAWRKQKFNWFLRCTCLDIFDKFLCRASSDKFWTIVTTICVNCNTFPDIFTVITRHLRRNTCTNVSIY